MKSFKQNYYKIVALLGIILSLLWVIFVNTQPYSDFAYYNTIAKQVANGGQWGNTYTSVGYSIILGFVYKLFGSSLITAKLFNLVLTCLSYLIFYKLLIKLPIKEGRRKIVYTLFVLFPSNIFYNSILGTEIIFTTIFLLATLIYFSEIKYKYVLIGILVAVNSMIKPFFLALFFAIFLVELLSGIKFLQVIKHTVIILAVSFLVLSPWVYRNTKLMGQFTFISNNGGIVMYINNNSQNNYGRWMAAANVENSIVNTKEYKKANMTAKNKMLSTAAKKWIVSHPGRFIGLGFKRLINTYFVGDDILYAFDGAGISAYLQYIFIAYASLAKNILFIPAIVLMIISTVKVILNLIGRKSIESFTLYSLICFYMFTCVYFVTEGQGRYSFPVIFIAVYFFSELIFSILSAVKKLKNKVHL
ncbi:hypothetical protein [Clostridium pasteurianum]|uniref:Glycosyltransferase RgtA/B/C/D-like domain-containing protein n=1 Tax=Clostridium pasteurianum BC1 TaxID=86416 RepID=R4K5K7_CLOPA|nr:hypothetical protein [Clostridium pasteurianum]AGK95819.1 hypothetical protein Clopa_0789 [Clostridium pasteurianum BC1]